MTREASAAMFDLVEAYGKAEARATADSHADHDTAAKKAGAALLAAIAAIEAERDAAVALVHEACDGWAFTTNEYANCVEGEGYDFDRAGGDATIEAVRAKAALTPGADR